jgi:hypothetical protein
VIPELPSLETIYIYVDPRRAASLARTAKLARGDDQSDLLGLFPLCLPKVFLQQLARAPKLVSIRVTTYKQTVKSIPTKVEYGKHSASEWDQHNICGILIRTYTNDAGDTLVILRRRTLCGWTLYADFNGTTPSAATLEMALHISGEMSLEWQAPGRDLGLTMKGWQLLNQRRLHMRGIK